MNSIIDKFTKRTVGMQIIQLLNKKGSMRFSEIKKGLGNPNDNIVNREIKNLMKLEPPLIMKSPDKLYSLNEEHPEINKILILFKILPMNDNFYPVLVINDILGKNRIGVTVTTSSSEGFHEDASNFFNEENIADTIAQIYQNLVMLKFQRVVKNMVLSGELTSDVITDHDGEKCISLEFNETCDILSSVYKEGIQINIAPEIDNEWEDAINASKIKNVKESLFKKRDDDEYVLGCANVL